MTRWQYRVQQTNLDWDQQWHDVYVSRWPIGIVYCSNLEFRRKPGPLAFLAAAFHRGGRP